MSPRGDVVWSGFLDGPWTALTHAAARGVRTAVGGESWLTRALRVPHDPAGSIVGRHGVLDSALRALADHPTELITRAGVGWVTWERVVVFVAGLRTACELWPRGRVEVGTVSDDPERARFNRFEHGVMAVTAVVNSAVRGSGDPVDPALVEWLDWRVELAWDDPVGDPWTREFDAAVRRAARAAVRGWRGSHWAGGDT